MKPMLLSFLKLIGWPLFRILFSVEYHGVENVPASGPVVIAGNHPSYLDPALVALPVKRPIRYIAWDALFKVPVLGALVKALGAFPVDLRRGRGEAAYREALRVLARGEALGIFPEGQRSDQGPMGELRTGAARLAIETGAPIVPVTIGGAVRAWPKWRLLPKPAQVIVRFHQPIRLDEAERLARRDDRDYPHEVMRMIAASINRSLTPALRGAEALERWYRQPPSHIRTFEWAPLAVALLATLLAQRRQALAGNYPGLWLPAAAYYLYLIADLALIEPSRVAKWLRNSMPLWLILAWHHQLVAAAGAPAGELNAVLLAAVLAAFFPFFWESYYTLQKFVRGLVVVYYSSLALLTTWPHPLGVFVSVLSFMAIFSLWYRTSYYPAKVAAMLFLIAVAILWTGAASWALLAYGALAVAALLYLQTFINAAYDIRQAGEVSVQQRGDQAAG
jgi:1-acyl-sn-glycerol-3-phosphate acyltransferase